MGNIQHKSLSKLFPTSYMQDTSTRSQQNNRTNDRNSQFITSAFNPKKQSLLQLTVSDNIELQHIMDTVALYSTPQSLSQSLKYPCISALKEYYRIKKQGYCTNQYLFYLIFHGCGCCGLRDQFGVRKIMNKKFADEQIITILKTYLAGVFVYIKQFKRNVQKIDLDDIGFQILSQNKIQTNENNGHNGHNKLNHIQQINLCKKVRMYFIDPWLKQKKQHQILTVNQVNILLQNPSPQRLQESSNTFDKFNQRKNFSFNVQNSLNNDHKNISSNQKQFLSLLFSVGVIGLKLLEMNFVDDIYIRSPSKKVNFQKILTYLQKKLSEDKISGNSYKNHNEMYNSNIIRQKLINGLRILLLSNIPKQREKIFEFWNVRLDEINQLKQISLQNCQHFQSDRENKNQNQRNQNKIQQISAVQTSDQINNQNNNNQKKRLYGSEEKNILINTLRPQKQRQLNSYERHYIYKMDQLRPQALNQQNHQINFQNSENNRQISNQKVYNIQSNVHTQQNIYRTTSSAQNQIYNRDIKTNMMDVISNNNHQNQNINSSSYFNSYLSQGAVNNKPFSQNMSNQINSRNIYLNK